MIYSLLENSPACFRLFSRMAQKLKSAVRALVTRNGLSRDTMPIETIERRILVLRGHRVLLDRDLAELYGVPLKRLNEQVKRNLERFPEDFMFRLTTEEGRTVQSVRSQIATLRERRHFRHLPHVFTEHGAVMLANVLKSSAAVHASIQVVRAFVRLRREAVLNRELYAKIESLDRRVGRHDEELRDVLRVLRSLVQAPPPQPKKPIGFLARAADPTATSLRP